MSSGNPVDASSNAPNPPPTPVGSATGPAGVAPPTLLALRALLPFGLLDLVFGSWAHQHLQWLSGWLAANLIFAGAFAAIWKWIPDEYIKGTKPLIAKALSSPTVTKVMWSLLVAFVFASLFVSSVRISVADPSSSVVVYRLTHAADSIADLSSISDSMRLDKKHSEESRLIFTTPLGVSEWFASSADRHTDEIRIRPWIVTTLSWPDDFMGPVTVVMLPPPKMRLWMNNPSFVLLQVTEGGIGGRLLAKEEIRSYGSWLVAGSRPIAPDSAVRDRWAKLANATWPKDSNVASIVDGWRQSHWIRVNRPLRVGERVGLLVLSDSGDTLAVQTRQLSQNFTDVILRRTP